MYSYYFHILDKETGSTKQVGCAQLRYAFSEGDVVSGNILWGSYEHSCHPHKIEDIEERFDGSFTVFLTITSGIDDKKNRDLHVIEVQAENSRVVVFRPRKMKCSKDLAGSSRLSRHRNGYCICR